MGKTKKALALLLSIATVSTSVPAITTMAAEVAANAAIAATATTTTPTSKSSSAVFADGRTDFRDESIYFVMTTRFYDGDSSNNVQCWDGTQYDDENDPEWRGDFKGLAEKLDYIKALGFTAIWITPVVENASGYDYHGYHAINFSKVDPRYESDDFDYQDFIDAAHAKGMKVIQDVVFNHTGNFGESNLLPIFSKVGDLSSPECLEKVAGADLPDNYDDLTPAEQYAARLALMKNTDGKNHDTENIYHHDGSMGWEEYSCQTGQIAGDCVDLNTENPKVYKYLQDAYKKYVAMGVDAFRVDTTKHISRLTFNNELIQPFYDEAAKNGNDSFYMFGEVCTRVREVWNKGIAPLSSPFYTWKETVNYPWSDTDASVNEASALANYNDNISPDSQPTSDNAVLSGNDYHTPDYSQRSGLGVIDFPMHWNFGNANDAFNVAASGDKWYNDATWNVTYVDSHDYAPDQAPENQRFAGSQDTWAENLSLMFSFRGIPCIYYGSEIEFQKGKVIDVGPNAPLSETGRAYYGDHIQGGVVATGFGEYFGATDTTKESLNYPLALHIQRLNQIRQAVPALRKGQYSTDGISGNRMAYKRRYTDASTDSYALITVSGSATFTGIPNGTYVDCITGDTQNVTGGTLTAKCSGKGNLRVYVLNTSKTPAPGKVGVDGKYLYSSSPVESAPAAKEGVLFKNTEGWSKVTANVYTSNGTLRESIPMSVYQGDLYAATIENGSGCSVVFTNGSSATTKAAFKNMGLYGTSGYIKQYVYNEDANPVTSVTLDKTSADLKLGETATFNATILPSNATTKTLTWTSSDKSVATVSKGVVTAIGEGTATITAKSNNGITATATVKVTMAPYNYKPVPEGYTAIYFKKPASWGTNVNCYAYYGSSTKIAGEWPGTAMTRLPNGVYQFIYETPAGNPTVKVLFNSNGVQAPASGGFTVEHYGLYDETGKIGVIEPVDPTLTVSLKASVASPQTKGTAVKFTATAENGEGTVQYQFRTEKNGTSSIIQNYSTTNSVSFNPTTAGTYTIYVDAKDTAGNTVTEKMSYTWNEVVNPPVDDLTATLTASPSGSAVTGTTVILTAKASGGSGNYTYRFLQCNDKGVSYMISDYTSKNTVVWKTGAVGKKTIYVDVKDSNGTVKRESVPFEVKAATATALTASLTASPSGSAVTGSAVTLTAKANGGSGSYTYKFLVCDAKGNWYKLRDFASGNTFKWPTGSVGKKTLYVDVKDSKGTVKRASISFEVKAATTAITATLTASPSGSAVTGSIVTLTAKASGGSGSYTYRFVQSNDKGVSYTISDYTSKNTATWKTGAVGKKTVYVDVKDSNGTVKRVSIPFEVKAATTPTLTATLTASPSGSAVTGSTVTLTTKASGGVGSYIYKFLVCDANGKWYTISDYTSKNVAAWKTGAAGKKTLYVDVKDSNGTVKRVSIPFEVKTKEAPLTITSFTMSEATGKPAGTPVKFTVNATGGTGKLQYMFYCEKDCYVSIFRNYAETNYVTCNLGTGKYNIYVDVKDENGNVKTSMVTYEWK